MTSKAIKFQEGIIKKYNEAYRKGTPIVSDAVYDREVEKLKRLDPNHRWFKTIEPAPVTKKRKVKLPIPMKSLYKVKSTYELKKWFSTNGISELHRVVVTPKFDGLSLLHNETDGMTYSRGGSENEGQDCTRHYNMAGYTKVETELTYTYGEFVFNKDTWCKQFENQISPETGEMYKSARNTAAGLLNRDEPSELLKHVDFFRYGTSDDEFKRFHSYSDFYEYICDKFNQPKLMYDDYVCYITENKLEELFEEWSNQYFIDGLVIYIDDIKLWEMLGRQETTGNPNYAIAYKNPSFTDVFKTEVKGISWAISKSGCFKPVVNIDTVDTGDCAMENPTGYNARYINDNKIAKGAVVKVTRSGGVIPKILEVVSPASDEELDKEWSKLELCPYCGSPTAWSKSGAEMRCTNENCCGKRLAEITFFYETVGAENFGPDTIKKIYDAGFTTLSNMLDITFEELVNIEGIGDEIANQILKNNVKIRSGVDIAVLMQASNCFPGVGQVKATQILEQMTETRRFAFTECVLSVPKPEVLWYLPWFQKASKTKQSFFLGANNFYDFVATNKLTIIPLKEKQIDKDGKYAGFKVCFTGVRSKLLEENIIAGGGEIANSITKTVTHLVVDDVNSMSTKMRKAQEYGIKILTMDGFKSL